MTRVKICGFTREEDVRLAVELGADAIGFVLEPSSRRCVCEPELLGRLAACVPPFVEAVAVYAAYDGSELPSAIAAVQAFPGVASHSRKRIMAFRQCSDLTVASVLKQAVGCDAVLLDAYDPVAYGGTGKTVDFGFARELRSSLKLPLILAGGLNPMNVVEAIRAVGPYAVDVSSGVEVCPGVKDPKKIAKFISAVKGT